VEVGLVEGEESGSDEGEEVEDDDKFAAERESFEEYGDIAVDHELEDERDGVLAKLC